MDIRWRDLTSPDGAITRTRFIYNGHKVSAIQGFGTYGGPDLLEMMIDGKEPTGSLEASDCFDILDSLEEGKKIEKI